MSLDELNPDTIIPQRSLKLVPKTAFFNFPLPWNGLQTFSFLVMHTSSLSSQALAIEPEAGKGGQIDVYIQWPPCPRFSNSGLVCISQRQTKHCVGNRCKGSRCSKQDAMPMLLIHDFHKPQRSDWAPKRSNGSCTGRKPTLPSLPGSEGGLKKGRFGFFDSIGRTSAA